MQDKRLINVAVCAPIKENKILLIKRVKPPYAGYWGLPGGKVDFGEHPEETAIRELKEETGIDCDFAGFKGIASEIIHENDEKTDHFIFYICKLIPRHEDHHHGREGEIAAVRWANLEELDEKEIVPSDLLFLREIILKDSHVDLHKVKITKKDEEYIVEEFGR